MVPIGLVFGLAAWQRANPPKQPSWPEGFEREAKRHLPTRPKARVHAVRAIPITRVARDAHAVRQPDQTLGAHTIQIVQGNPTAVSSIQIDTNTPYWKMRRAAEREMDAGRWPEARKRLEAWRRANTEDAWSGLALFDVYVAVGEYARALQLIYVVPHVPYGVTSTEARYWLRASLAVALNGHLYRGQEDFIHRVAGYTGAAVQKPMFPSGHGWQAVACESALLIAGREDGTSHEAIAFPYVEIGLKLDPTNPQLADEYLHLIATQASDLAHWRRAADYIHRSAYRAAEEDRLHGPNTDGWTGMFYTDLRLAELHGVPYQPLTPAELGESNDRPQSRPS